MKNADFLDDKGLAKRCWGRKEAVCLKYIGTGGLLRGAAFSTEILERKGVI